MDSGTQDLPYTEEERLLQSRYQRFTKLLLRLQPSSSSANVPIGPNNATDAAGQPQSSPPSDGSPPSGSPSSDHASGMTTAAGLSSSQTSEQSTTSGQKRAKVLRVLPSATSLAATQGEAMLLDHDPKFDIWKEEWDSRLSSKPFMIKLDGLDLDTKGDSEQGEVEPDKKNTLVIWAVMPAESERMAFNIGKTESYLVSDSNTHLVYHMHAVDQPKQQKQHILQSSLANKTWSPDADRSIRGLPITKNKEFQLRLTFCQQGIAVYLDGRLVTEYSYRFGSPANKEPMYLISTIREEQYGEPEKVIINRVWWGHTIPHVPGTDKKKVAFADKTSASSTDVIQNRQSQKSSSHPTTDRQAAQTAAMEDTPADRALFVTGLPKDRSAESQLTSIFEHYQVDTVNGRLCLLADSAKGQGVVKLQNSRNVEKAISYLNGAPASSGGKLTVLHAKRKQVPNWFEC